MIAVAICVSHSDDGVYDRVCIVNSCEFTVVIESKREIVSEPLVSLYRHWFAIRASHDNGIAFAYRNQSCCLTKTITLFDFIAFGW